MKYGCCECKKILESHEVIRFGDAFYCKTCWSEDEESDEE